MKELELKDKEISNLQLKFSQNGKSSEENSKENPNQNKVKELELKIEDLMKQLGNLKIF